jgi:hypothetical protein
MTVARNLETGAQHRDDEHRPGSVTEALASEMNRLVVQEKAGRVKRLDRTCNDVRTDWS